MLTSVSKADKEDIYFRYDKSIDSLKNEASKLCSQIAATQL